MSNYAHDAQAFIRQRAGGWDWWIEVSNSNGIRVTHVRGQQPNKHRATKKARAELEKFHREHWRGPAIEVTPK